MCTYLCFLVYLYVYAFIIVHIQCDTDLYTEKHPNNLKTKPMSNLLDALVSSLGHCFNSYLVNVL